MNRVQGHLDAVDFTEVQQHAAIVIRVAPSRLVPLPPLREVHTQKRAQTPRAPGPAAALCARASCVLLASSETARSKRRTSAPYVEIRPPATREAVPIRGLSKETWGEIGKNLPDFFGRDRRSGHCLLLRRLRRRRGRRSRRNRRLRSGLLPHPFAKLARRCRAPIVRLRFLHRLKLDGLQDLPGFQAARADVLAPRGALNEDADLLKVRVEAPPRSHHGVAAVVPERRALAARVTDLCHGASG